ncbi:MAG: hypothetical protein R3251_00945 [Candidatus Spechtbacterales bacterium]|nr:hypothetical protein [Candidatus Spechtbacterales bacterium]
MAKNLLHTGPFKMLVEQAQNDFRLETSHGRAYKALLLHLSDRLPGFLDIDKPEEFVEIYDAAYSMVVDVESLDDESAEILYYDTAYVIDLVFPEEFVVKVFKCFSKKYNFSSNSS